MLSLLEHLNQRKKETALLKGYLKRLGEGEELESVRADFVEKFNSVDASEIMQAEQELIAEGTPITEIQKLCDLHSALFHGATQEEKIANAGNAVIESMKAKKQEEIKNTLAANSTGPMSTAEEREKASAGQASACIKPNCNPWPPTRNFDT